MNILSVVAAEIFSYKTNEIYALRIAVMLKKYDVIKIPIEILDKNIILKPDKR
ncbi:MAG: hypothetical protein GX287_05945 [Fusobacteria bacterium]|nr:hypothetical protein [Fusobacteriota bacterium]